VSSFVAESGPLEGQRFEIAEELTIGREDQALTVDEPGVSRRHAVVRASGDVVTIEDLGSLNGTFVNGAKIDARTTIGHGDTVRIGGTSFRFQSARAGETVAVPAPRVEAPDLPFGAFAAGNVTGRHPARVASRQLVPELITVLAIVFTASALILYFGLR
jgi:hypothetical protein